jgi:hypothetical protein
MSLAGLIGAVGLRGLARGASGAVVRLGIGLTRLYRSRERLTNPIL